MSTTLQILGLGSIAAGSLLLSLPAGLIVTGIILALVGFSLGVNK